MSLLFSVIPEVRDVLALEPEDLAGILLELVPHLPQAPRFLVGSFMSRTAPYNREYPPGADGDIGVAVAEAMSWMETQGIIVQEPGQAAGWFLLTRRGRQLSSRAELESYRKAHTLPRDLLQPPLAEKVYPLFARGDHETAVFQAFKEVEVAVRAAAHCPPELLGTKLMERAFNPEDGPLTDKALVAAERRSEMFLFSGAIGHAKNPTSHRDVNLSREEAARLIVFASHLLDIVEKRAAVRGNA